MAAQRDMQQEREQKFAMIKELMQVHGQPVAVSEEVAPHASGAGALQPWLMPPRPSPCISSVRRLSMTSGGFVRSSWRRQRRRDGGESTQMLGTAATSSKRPRLASASSPTRCAVDAREGRGCSCSPSPDTQPFDAQARAALARRIPHGDASFEHTHPPTLQVQGWDSEFERLQSFTRMDSKFEPGQKHIVEEITSRFLEKERTNTSLLRFLHEQEVSVTRNAGARQAARLDAHPADPLGAIADSPFTTADPMPPTQCSFLILCCSRS